MKTKPDLKGALRELVESVRIGMEYPEAHWHCILMYSLSVAEGETLTQMYDECGGNLK